jgi:hypothetical protein
MSQNIFRLKIKQGVALDALNNPKKPNENNLHMNTLVPRGKNHGVILQKNAAIALFSSL